MLSSTQNLKMVEVTGLRSVFGIIGYPGLRFGHENVEVSEYLVFMGLVLLLSVTEFCNVVGMGLTSVDIRGQHQFPFCFMFYS